MEARAMADHGLGPKIEQFFSQISAGAGTLAKSSTLPDAIVEEVVGSGKVRSGPRPSPESIIAMTEVVAYYVNKKQPIPFIVPWGPKKPNDLAGVDLAEYGALLALTNLNERISTHYKPGIVARIRVEDLCGFYLLRENGESAVNSITQYVESFGKLVSIMGNGVITPVLESSLADYAEYAAIADSLMPSFVQYITDTDRVGLDNYKQHESWLWLTKRGWQGSIPIVQREYYRARYRTLYPGYLEEKYTEMLAQYLAYTMTRGILGTYGTDSSWGTRFLQINFTSPVPGAPSGVIERKIHYRTFPANITKDRIPPWKAKGYFAVDGDHVVPATASWHEKLDLIQHQTVLTGDQTTVVLQTDYATA